MKTYYIVKHYDVKRKPYWEAHKRGIRSAFNVFNIWNTVIQSLSYSGPDECETYLKNFLYPIKPKVVRVVKV